ncbi:hypothetical protein VOLCADRAFT_78789 [Volvox carteri f. nagariensis]|uniref:Cation-transporting P-type ATPase N-terminal domain-containing protein n=1 Tax=Volvox carteri f. nagariensis TaxID=3068 RepID=D8THV5_VOLCA|nr:uncharacterized protein VOLCADRAFT_78789 [Volvox carteri f. nagariensis]EFJ52783.1 hypothetical protein VOLCADRAFT_78789 [Volvox carteri f. nagariensis]|eukprot:XP_002945788.1 hypothetical protein VOLCADRAFT_78789 [Volvox carteri f. nagariensis]
MVDDKSGGQRCFGIKNNSKSDSDKQKNLRKDLPIVAHEFSLDELAAEYSVSLERGLTSAQVLESRQKHGPNRLTPPKVKPAWWVVLYLEQYTNFFSLLLIAGGILCFIAYGIDQSDASNLYLGAVLIAVVFISSTFAYFQEAKSQAIMDGFKSLIPKKCKVVRDGAANVLDAVELVPGDLVEFQEGDQVPADVRVIDSYNLKVDNSALTGTSVHPYILTKGLGGAMIIPAIEATNLLFYSTIVASGHGRGVVIGTGDNTVMGQIAGLTGETQGDSQPPIVREVNRFITIISGIAITIGIVFLAVGIGLGVMTVVQALVFAISVIVAVVPEGLLVTLTVALALTAKRMHNKNVLVKNLQSVETLGCTTVIASDKTGTLTQNRMTVQHCWYDNQLYDVPAARNMPELQKMMADSEKKGPSQGWPLFDPKTSSFQMLQRIATLCNNSDFIVQDKFDPTRPLLDLEKEALSSDFNLLGLQTTGDASESGLIKAVQLLHDVKKYRAEYPKLFEIKFNSTNKYQIGIHDQRKDGDTRPLLLMKGAPERVWAASSYILINGHQVPKTEKWEAAFNSAYESLGALGERVLGFAYANLDGLPHNHPWTDQPAPNFPVQGLVFCGLMSLIDPPRLGVPEAVTTCKRASVRVFMVTGDHPITARAIAEQIGILDKEVVARGKGKVVTGDDIRNLMAIDDDAKREAAWDDILLKNEQIVFARVTPAHKLLIVENNQRLKRVVAVTGDGVNDAPALKKADIGISMGIAGKDVSKEAADMILMDDNFASIVNGVEEGRLIFDNLKKSINYTLTSKVPELSPFLLWVIAGIPLATTTILILAIDLGTDMIPAISFAYETREADIMSRPPRDAHSDHLVNLKLLLFTYLHIGVMQALAGWFGFFVCMNDYGYNPRVMYGIGHSWDDAQLLCSIRDDGTVSKCGFGCKGPNSAAVTEAVVAAAGLAKFSAAAAAMRTATADFCKEGCFASNNYSDPFSEFAPGGRGFRGFALGPEAVCSRTCSWYNGLGAAERAFYLTESTSTTSPYRNILTPEDDRNFKYFCGSAFNATLSATFGFGGRGEVDKNAEAPTGSLYYWRAAHQNVPNPTYQRHVLSQGQTAYFVAVVMNKIIAALMSKTRKLSIFSQGVLNNKFMLGGFVFEACLVVLIAYVPPLNVVFNTGPISGLHWLPGLPWFLLCFVYDETRKALMRANPGGWVERLTYW